jgi:hypothetical protein
LFPSFQRAPSVAATPPIEHRPPTHAYDIAEYRKDMTLVEYCGLRLRNRPRATEGRTTTTIGA